MLAILARVVRGLSLGIWLGAGVMTFIAAHYVFFGHYDDAAMTPFLDKSKAGDVMGAILHAGGWMKVGLAMLALVSHYLAGCGAGNESCGTRARTTRWITLGAAALIALFVTLYLEPKMLDLRAQFKGDPDPANPAHVLFRSLHGGSMGLAVLELIFVAATLICVLI